MPDGCDGWFVTVLLVKTWQLISVFPTRNFGQKNDSDTTSMMTLANP